MKDKLILISILFLVALGLRVMMISQVPMSLNWDEASFGYNAYSLLMTGKDEYGKFMPLQFLSVGDYKCPLYIYMLVPAIKIFGLTEFSVRAVPALLGALTVPLLYMITRRVNRKAAFWAALLLAISPWHLQFTRAGADVAVSSFFVILGVALGFRKMYAIAGISLGLTIYSYFGERAFTPLLLGLMIWMFRRKSINLLLAFAVTVIPIISILASSGHQNKVENTTILGYRASDEFVQKTMTEDYLPSVYYLFHNELIEKSRMVISRYAAHFSPVFLFINGPEDGRQRIDGMGMLYRSDVLLLIAFSYWIFGSRQKNRYLQFVLIWLLIAPIPAAITKDPVHARRAFNMIYPLSIILGIGAYYLWTRKSVIMKAVFLGLFVWSICFYLVSYYIFTPRSTHLGSAGWQYGYKQLVESVSPVKSKYQQVVVDTSYQGPYIFFLFYEKYPPEKYHSQARLVREKETELGEGAGYDNYVFRPVWWPDDRYLKNSLVIGGPDRIPAKDIDPKERRLLETIYFPDGKEAWKITEDVSG